MQVELAYTFGHFRLLPLSRSLFAGGQSVKLGGRAFDLLLTLVEHDRVLSKDELMQSVWPRLVVEENNLNVQILMLRKLLGHPAIATVPGRGYRLALTVSHEGAKPNASVLARRSVTYVHPIEPAHEASVAPGNLPAQVSTLYGRKEDLETVAALLAEHKLVTVAGAGGIGKTRLGQAVAARSSRDHPDGVWWVELAPVTQGSLVAAAVAEVLGVDLSDGRDATQSVVAHLHDRKLLLVLDNCEQVLDAVAALAAAIGAAAPDLCLLVTSQEVLRSAGEHVYRLGTLSLPDATAPLSVESVGASGAGALFVARARAVDARFELTQGNVEAVTDICRRLDGIPLAIELAAARLPLLGVDGVRLRLNQRFNLLTGGSRAVLRRHQTLRAALDWSHELLSPAERAVFRRLGVFAGGFTLESAQHVAQDEQIDEWDVVEHLGALVDKSIVVPEGDPIPRYRFLETTRLFALERLGDAGETESILKRHVEAMINLLAAHDRATSRRINTLNESALLTCEADNVRAALDWLSQERPEADARALDDLAVELAGVAGEALSLASGSHEAYTRVLAIRDRLNADTPPALAARYWGALGGHGRIAGHEASFDAGLRGVKLSAQIGDDLGLFNCLITVIAIGARRGAGALLESYVNQATTVEPADPVLRIHLRWARYRWLMSIGSPQEALECELDGARIAREAGLLLTEQLRLGDTVADCEMALGRLDEAERHCRDALEVIEREPESRRHSAHVMDTLSRVLALQGKHEEAIATGRKALQMTRNEGFHFRLLEPLALNAAEQGRLNDAAWVSGHVDATYAARGEVRWPDALERRARLDTLLAALDPKELGALRAQGASANVELAFARVFGDV